jgi:hypothetical protein
MMLTHRLAYGPAYDATREAVEPEPRSRAERGVVSATSMVEDVWEDAVTAACEIPDESHVFFLAPSRRVE